MVLQLECDWSLDFGFQRASRPGPGCPLILAPVRSRLLLALLVASCGSSDPKALTDSGSAALNSGDPARAVSEFDRALEHMDAGHPEYLRASIGRCQALARIDPNRAKEEFLALARAQPSKVREPDFATVAAELVRHNAITPAVAVAEAGMRMFPESPSMKSLLDLVGDAAKKASDPAALKRLKGLGYAGDN